MRTLGELEFLFHDAGLRPRELGRGWDSKVLPNLGSGRAPFKLSSERVTVVSDDRPDSQNVYGFPVCLSHGLPTGFPGRRVHVVEVSQTERQANAEIGMRLFI